MSFSFQHFTIQQDQCAMKVGTDGMLLGAWARAWHIPEPGHILDIGTGTGILALMLAQRSPRTLIDALEIEALAAQQALENVQASPWKERIQVIHQAIQDWQPEYAYDLLVCNPPYFSDALSTGNQARNLARQTHRLNPAELLHTQRLLKPEGTLSLVLPVQNSASFKVLALKSGLKLTRQCSVQHSTKHPISRLLMEWQKQPGDDKYVFQEEALILKEGPDFSKAYRQLTAGYHLGSPHAPAADF